jgi:hypothetical protein
VQGQVQVQVQMRCTCRCGAGPEEQVLREVEAGKTNKGKGTNNDGGGSSMKLGGHVNQKKRKATEPTIERPCTLTMRTRRYEGVRK